jgi:hypothetical protein
MNANDLSGLLENNKLQKQKQKSERHKQNLSHTGKKFIARY